MFCRNFSSAVASWVAERLLSPLPVIHHSDNEKFKYPKQSAPDTGTIPDGDDGEGIRIIRD